MLIDTIIFKSGYQFCFNTLEETYDNRLKGTLTQDEFFKIIQKYNNIIKKNNKWVFSCIVLTLVLVSTSIPLILHGYIFWWLLFILIGILFLSIQWIIQFQINGENQSPELLSLSLSQEFKNRYIIFNWKKINFYNNSIENNKINNFKILNNLNTSGYYLCITHPKQSLLIDQSNNYNNKNNKIENYYSDNKHLLNNNENEKLLNHIISNTSYSNNNKQLIIDEGSNEEGIPLLATSKKYYKDLVVN